MRKSSNVNKLWRQLLLATLVLLMGTSALTSLTYAYIPGPGAHVAWFLNDPYPAESANITIRYHCDNDDTMYVNLTDPNGATVQTWFIDTHMGYLYYSAPCGAGKWSLTCDVWGEATKRDSAYQLFNISDTDPDQIDLATDILRHPQNSDIIDMALSVVDYPTSSLDAVHAICHHVNNTPTDASYFTWTSDLDILNHYKTTGKYSGWCQVAAVAVTSYARALGIPTRIIQLYGYNAPIGEPGDPDYIPAYEWMHWFGECRIYNGTSYEWIPVDGDVSRGLCGWSEYNAYLHRVLPSEQDSFSVEIIKNFTDAGNAVYMTYPPPIPYSNAGP